MNDHTPDAQATRQRPAARWLILLLILVAIAFGAWWVLRPSCTVEGVYALTWPASETSSAYNSRTEVRLGLTGTRSKKLIDAEIIVDQWTDDQGKDLLIRQVPIARNDHGRMYKIYSQMGGSALAVGTPNPPDRLLWNIATPETISPGAQSVRLQGRAVLVEGRKTQIKRIPKFRIRTGASFTIGTHEYVVSDRKLIAPEGAPAIKRIDVITRGDHNATSDERWGLLESSRRKHHRGPEDPVVWTYGLKDPPRRSEVTLVVEYWSEQRLREVPFDVAIPLEHKTEKQIIRNDHALVPTPVPDDTWGPEVPDGSPGLPLFSVRPLSCTIYRGDIYRSQFGWVSADFDVQSRIGKTVASYDLMLTGCRDDQGYELLADRPLRTSVWGTWRMYRRLGGPVGSPQRALPAFRVETNYLPSRNATSLTFSGTMRIKTAQTPQTVAISDFRLIEGESFTVGPVTYTLEQIEEDSLLFLTTGDQGLVRTMKIMTPDNRRVICSVHPDLPFLYWSDREAFFRYALDLTWVPTSPDVTIGEYGIPEEPVIIEATYLTEWSHRVVPFEVTYPISPDYDKTGKPAPRVWVR